MSTPLRVLRGAVEKFQRYNEELPLRRIGCGTRGGTIDPQTYRPRLRGVISLLKVSATKKVCYKHALKSRFFSGINFFIVPLISFRRRNFAKHLVCLLSLSPSSYLFSSSSSLSFCLLLLIPTLFPS